jgi:hypothetical protein
MATAYPVGTTKTALSRGLTFVVLTGPADAAAVAFRRPVRRDFVLAVDTVAARAAVLGADVAAEALDVALSDDATGATGAADAGSCSLQQTQKEKKKEKRKNNKKKKRKNSAQGHAWPSSRVSDLFFLSLFLFFLFSLAYPMACSDFDDMLRGFVPERCMPDWRTDRLRVLRAKRAIFLAISVSLAAVACSASSRTRDFFAADASRRVLVL